MGKTREILVGDGEGIGGELMRRNSFVVGKVEGVDGGSAV